MRLFLGIDGGQSHTAALVADENGRILGRGSAGPSNHTREPGGRERLIEAVTGSAGRALSEAGICVRRLGDFRFLSAHLAMTGEPADKIAIVREILQADHLEVAHDAPAALAGALAGEPGIMVLAGTGSVACGMTSDGRFVRVGGHGYLFDDRGSAFAIARDALSNALSGQDRGLEGELAAELTAWFDRSDISAIAQDVYAGVLSRDELAGFAARVGSLAESGSEQARMIIDRAAADLAELAAMVAGRLDGHQSEVRITYGGGVFRSALLMERFRALIQAALPGASIVPPRFGPDVGAMLLAFTLAGRTITSDLLQNISQSVTL